MNPTRIATGTAVTILAAGVAYAFYFDYKRRHDMEFRKSLEREKKRHRKLQKQAEEAETEQNQAKIKNLVKKAQQEGFPTEIEEREAYFMEEVAAAEKMLGSEEKALDAAMCFYKALKVYSQPRELIKIYEQTIPPHVLDLLGKIIAEDSSVFNSGTVSEPLDD